MLPAICWSNPEEEEEEEEFVSAFLRKNNHQSVSWSAERLVTFQCVERFVQIAHVAVDEFQSAFGFGLGDVDSVQQLVEVLQREITQIQFGCYKILRLT